MNRIKKWLEQNPQRILFIKIGLILLGIILLIAFPALYLVLSGIGIWYFVKKAPDIRKRNLMIGLFVVSFVAVALQTPTVTKKISSSQSETNQTATSTTSTASTTDTSSSIEEAKRIEEEKKAKEKALAQQAQKKNNEVKKIPRKYIQVATLSSEAAARSAVSKLGGSFSYQKIAGKGKTLYVIVSVSTDNQATLSSLENQVKSKLPSSKYIVRTAGK